MVTSEKHNMPNPGSIPTFAVGWTDNLILCTDSYKYSHWKQYPKGTEYASWRQKEDVGFAKKFHPTARHNLS
eukprot:g26027.t1